MPDLTYLFHIEIILDDMGDVFQEQSEHQRLVREVAATLQQARFGALPYEQALAKLQRMMATYQQEMFHRDRGDDKAKESVECWHLLCVVALLLEHFLKRQES